MYFTFMYKTLGEYSWSSIYKESEPLECPAKVYSNIVSGEDGTITKSAQEFHLALENLKSVSNMLLLFVCCAIPLKGKCNIYCYF